MRGTFIIPMTDVAGEATNLLESPQRMCPSRHLSSRKLSEDPFMNVSED